MKLYAFDMTIYEQQRILGRTPPPMLHDGEIFVSTDGRQKVTALEIAHRLSLEAGGQYITGMNEDVVPRELFSEGFDFDECVCLKLYDGPPENKLLGIDFDPNAPKKKDAEGEAREETPDTSETDAPEAEGEETDGQN